MQEQGPTISQQQTKEQLKQAYTQFNLGKYEQAQQIYTQILQTQGVTLQAQLNALKNRASLYAVTKQFTKSSSDLQKYILLTKSAVSPQIYCMYLNSLIKSQQYDKAKQVAQTALQIYPYHKKLQQLSKLGKQKQITQDQETYVQHIFQKLCMHPKIREYLKEESFLTKVQRLIRNPALGNQLQKMDPRIMQVSEFMLMAQEEA